MDVPIGVFIVDNQPIAIACLKVVLQTDPRFRVVGSAISGHDALAKLDAADNVDIVLMDYLMPTLNGIATMSRLLDSKPKPKFQVVMLSVENDLNTALDSLQKGAAGYLLRTTDFLVFANLLVRIHQQRNCIALDPHLIRQPVPSHRIDFEAQELEVIKLLLDEYSSLEIAETLRFRTKADPLQPDKTRVDHIIRNIRSKMGVENLAGLVRFALEHWIVPNYTLTRPKPPAIPYVPMDTRQTVPIFIVDDDAILLSGLEVVFRQFPDVPRLQAVGTATNALDGIASIEAYFQAPTTPDDAKLLVIMDIEMPGMNGLQATAQLCQTYGERVRIVVCTLRDSYQSGQEAIDLGATAYVTKDREARDLIQIFWAAWHGHTYLGVACPPQQCVFSDEETAIIYMIWEQHTTPEIARVQKLTEDYVDNKRRAIMRKMDVDNVVGLIKYVWLHRLFDGD